ncbi:unnamed protein product [Menidia menidia]|uniref:(Atlantic silverside) hypothetical protein n=1 Tax=Menidia menidia TaxID=238744 RepID=A0A8S4BC90_9TELE|nr:unnamed protein product [Menidia menidia]
MFTRLEVLVLSCLFVTTELKRGKILPPQNLTLLWINAFEPQLSWEPSQHPGAEYEVCTETEEEHGNECSVSAKIRIHGISQLSKYILMQGRILRWSVKTLYEGNESESVVLNISYPVYRFLPELVQDLSCYSSSAKQGHCSWSPVSNSTDLSFFYRLVDEAGSSSSSNLKECSLYNYTGGVKTGCDLQTTTNEAIHILFNGTLNNTAVWNTFRFETKDNVKPPALKWSATKDGNRLNIRWTPPDVLSIDFWSFEINYTECDTMKSFKKQDVTSHLVNHFPQCPYCITMKAVSEKGSTPWSDLKCQGPDKDANLLVYIAVFIPLVIACLAAMTFKFYLKNKEKIFPKVPKPMNLLSDISENNNKIAIPHFSIPTEEEENCKVTLVTETEICKLNC